MLCRQIHLDQSTEAHADALQIDLVEQLKAGSVSFDLIFTLADISDNENDPAIAWPQDRETINAGTVVINSSSPQHNGACDGLRFDPLVLPEGIEPTKDPILNARSAAYAESYRRRAKESFFGLFKQGEE